MSKPTHLEQLKVSLMQEGDINNPSVDRQEESTTLELEIEVIEESNNAKKGVANLKISNEEELVEVAMEIQAKSLEITTNVLEKNNILVEKTKKMFQQYK